MTALFQAIDSFRPRNAKDTFQPILLSTYFRLTYTCGLRPNEGRNLMTKDVDLKSGEIQIMNSKHHKSRIVVMSDDMLSLAQSYAVFLNAAHPYCDFFFPSPKGTPYTAVWMQNKLKKFFAQTQPDISEEFLPAIRVYDPRHRFATAALNRWLDAKQNIQARLPYLQMYMGH